MNSKAFKPLLILLSLNICCVIFAQENQKLPITGQVVDYMARPVEGAEVAVIDSEYSYGEYSTKVIAPFVKTDKNGRFELQAEVSSQYGTFIVARKAGLAYAWDGLNYSSNTKSKGNFHLVLEKACTLSGKVVDHNGKPVPGVTVQAIPKTSYMSRLSQRPIFGPKEWFTTETDSNGVFSFDQFSADVSSDFHIKAPELSCIYKYTTHYQSACGFEVWRENIRLVLPLEGKIKGRVIEAQTGKSVGPVELLIQVDKDRENILNRYLPVTIVTDADGSFVCDGLPEGKNTIELAVKETQTADWIAEPVKVNVSPNQLAENVEVKVKKGGIVEFTVRQYDTEQPLPEINVSSYSQNFNARSITNEQGIAKQRLLPGEYQGYAGGKGYISWQVNQPIIVKEGDVTHVDIGLTKSPTISGIVFDANGQSAEDILVTIHPFGDHVYTDKDGRFAAWYEERQADKGLYIIARDIQNSLAAIVHTLDLKQPVKLSLNPALTVKGKIADANENGIPAARVTLGISFANCLSEIGAEILTDAQGLFEFKAIPQKPDNFNYWTSIHSAGFAPKEYDRITIQGEPDTTIDVGTIQLRPANLSVSGHVEDPNGLPEPRAIIFLQGQDGIDQPDKNTATNEQGKFVIKGIAEGPIRLQANFSSSPGGAGFTKAQAGDQNIKIVLGQTLVHTQHQSLMDKSLPDLSNLRIKPENTNGKAMLICFFDMEQRPSRNCLMQLCKRTQELAAKNIVIAAVQASQIEQSKLDEWLKDNNILFSVGIIEGDIEKIEYKWGVKSLPWLILADKQHIVRSQGFSINELEDKLKEITDVRQ